MKYLLILLLISTSSYALDFKDYVHKVRIDHYNTETHQHYFGWGSAVATDCKEYGYEGNTLLAACHLYISGNDEKCYELDILIKDTYYKATVLLYNVDRDLLLLKIEKNDLNLLKLGATPEIGDRLKALGYPFGENLKSSTGKLKYKVFSGEIKERILENSPTFWQSSAKIEVGYSGGPIVNQNNNVVGIICMYWPSEAGPDQVHQAIFSPITEIRLFLGTKSD